jgi:hypothetical protein
MISSVTVGIAALFFTSSRQVSSQADMRYLNWLFG